MRIGSLLLAAIATLSGLALAHDYWVVPAKFVVRNEQDMAVSLYVGEDFIAQDERHFERSRFTRLADLHGVDTVDLLGLGTEGSTPMLRMSVRGEGGHLLLVERSPSRIVLEPRKFEDYLRHEGLRSVLEKRALLGETDKPGRERYSRCLKALIQVGRAHDQSFGAIVGQTLEIVPESDPVFLEPGGVLTLNVRFRGSPLPGAQVESFSRQGSDIRSASSFTDAAGRVPVTIDRRGVWIIRLVQMVRCQDCADVDWESFWASYTFASADPSGADVEAPSMFDPRPAPSPAGEGHTLRTVVIALAVASGAVAFIAMRLRQRRHSRSP
jgi:uncharacterized GH25 family protein